MEAKVSLIPSLKKVYKKSKKCKLDTSIFKKLENELNEISKQLEISPSQALFFSIIFCQNLSKKEIDRNDIVEHLGCEAIDFMEYQTDIFSLIEKKYVRKVESSNDNYESIMLVGFYIEYSIQCSILEQNKDAFKVPEVNINSALDLVNYVQLVLDEVIDGKKKYKEASHEIGLQLQKNRNLPFIKILKRLKLSDEDICILLYFMYKFRRGDHAFGNGMDITKICDKLFDNRADSANFYQNIITGNHILIKKKLLEFEFPAIRGRFTHFYKISSKTQKIMRKYEILPEIEVSICEDDYEFLFTIQSLFVEKEKDFITLDEFLSLARELMQANEELMLMKELRKLQLKNIKYEILFLKALYDGLKNKVTEIENIAEVFSNSEKDAILFRNELMQESNQFIKDGLLELVEANFFNGSSFRLTEASKDILFSCGFNIAVNNGNQYSILPKDIKEKPLFYNHYEVSQLAMLREVLEENNFNKIQGRMAEKAMPTGVVALLYGYPGTGKTESIYQIAKQTNREIIHVDISQSKSMWFGESEKLIKKIFTRYKQYSKRCKFTPILLFNEADAIISKRKDSSFSNVAQTENTMQNILLEELESFEGICIATTNLVDNLDSAFERRFLFKIELSKPNLDTAVKIWESKLTNSTNWDVHSLASNFDFSGGQIDNIVKKMEMHEVLHGTYPTEEDILNWCHAEKLENSDRKRIGFN